MVEDVDGNRYLDFAAGIAVVATGHCHPEVVAAIKDQAERFLHMCATDFYYDSVVALAEGLTRRAPGPGPWRAFFANSGTEVVEAAIKLARLRTGRQKIVAFYGAFHGRTYGSMSLTASKPVQRRGYGPFLPEVLHTHYAYCYRCPVNRKPETCHVECLDLLTETMFGTTVDPREVAAIDRGAGAGRGRIRRPAPRLPEAAAGHHAPARDPAHRGRGPVRHGPHGPPLRERSLRPRARHRDPGQGHRLRHAPGRAPRPRRGHAVVRAADTAPPSAGTPYRWPRPSPRSGCSKGGSWRTPPPRGGAPLETAPERAGEPRPRGRRARARPDDRRRDRQGPRDAGSPPPSCERGSWRRRSGAACCCWAAERARSASLLRSWSTART